MSSLVLYNIIILAQLVLVTAFMLDRHYLRKVDFLWDCLFCVIPLGPVIRRVVWFILTGVVGLMMLAWAEFKSLE